MKGSPWRECLCVVLLALLLAWPMTVLTRRPERAEEASPHPVTSPEGSELLETWVDLRASHAPETIALYQEDRLLWEAKGERRMDAEVMLNLRHHTASLRAEVEWPEAVEEAYVEVRLEPLDHRAREAGGWGRGTHTFRWRFSWEEEL